MIELFINVRKMSWSRSWLVAPFAVIMTAKIKKEVFCMDLSFLWDTFSPLVLVGCLTVGYILKHWIADLDNKFIPTILAVFGVLLSCLSAWDVSLETMVYGAVTGLASTGLHQAFKQFVEGKNENQ